MSTLDQAKNIKCPSKFLYQTYFILSWRCHLCGPIKWQANLYFFEIWCRLNDAADACILYLNIKTVLDGFEISAIGIIHNLYVHKCLRVKKWKTKPTFQEPFSLGDNKIKSHHIFFPYYWTNVINFSIVTINLWPSAGQFCRKMWTLFIYDISWFLLRNVLISKKTDLITSYIWRI